MSATTIDEQLAKYKVIQEGELMMEWMMMILLIMMMMKMMMMMDDELGITNAVTVLLYRNRRVIRSKADSLSTSQ